MKEEMKFNYELRDVRDNRYLGDMGDRKTIQVGEEIILPGGMIDQNNSQRFKSCVVVKTATGYCPLKDQVQVCSCTAEDLRTCECLPKKILYVAPTNRKVRQMLYMDWRKISIRREEGEDWEGLEDDFS